jgi:hypothetical protein
MKALLGSLCVLALASLIANWAAADIATGLIAHYPFNGNALDFSGNGNNGTPTSTVALAPDRFGNPNAAYDFNGVDSWIEVPSSPSLSSPTTQLTMAAWVLMHGQSNVGQSFDPIVVKSSTIENAYMFKMATGPNYLNCQLNNWNNSYSTGRTLALEHWYHFAVTYNGAMIRFYQDGAVVDSATFSQTLNQDTRPLRIGSDTPGILEVFNGRLDDVRLYARALSPADIVELYGATTSVPQSGLGVLALRIAPNPEPANARIEFETPATGPASLEIYDVAGRRVRLLSSGVLPAGPHELAWDGHDDGGNLLPGGVFFCRLAAGGLVQTQRFARVR